jgi:hypothetical protein
VSEVEMSRLILMRLGEGASGGREPVPRAVFNVPAPAATKTTSSVSLKMMCSERIGQHTDHNQQTAGWKGCPSRQS